MRINGSVTHCEVFFLAGQKKATKGKAGLSALALVSDLVVSMGDIAVVADFFLRDL